MFMGQRVTVSSNKLLHVCANMLPVKSCCVYGVLCNGQFACVFCVGVDCEYAEFAQYTHEGVSGCTIIIIVVSLTSCHFI